MKKTIHLALAVAAVAMAACSSEGYATGVSSRWSSDGGYDPGYPSWDWDGDVPQAPPTLCDGGWWGPRDWPDGVAPACDPGTDANDASASTQDDAGATTQDDASVSTQDDGSVADLDAGEPDPDADVADLDAGQPADDAGADAGVTRCPRGMRHRDGGCHR